MPIPPNNPPNGDPNVGQPPVVNGATAPPNTPDLSALPPMEMGQSDKGDYNPQQFANIQNVDKVRAEMVDVFKALHGREPKAQAIDGLLRDKEAEGATLKDTFVEFFTDIAGRPPKPEALTSFEQDNPGVWDKRVANNAYGIQGIDDDTVQAAEFLMNNPEQLLRAFQDIEDSGDTVGTIGTFLSNLGEDVSNYDPSNLPDDMDAAIGGESTADPIPSQVKDAIDTLTYLMEKQAGSQKRLEETDAYADQNPGFAQRELSPDTLTPEEQDSADTARAMLADLKAAIARGDAKKVARIYQMSKAVKDADEAKAAKQKAEAKRIEVQPEENVQKSEPSAILGRLYKDGEYVDVKGFLADMSMATDAYYNNSFQVDTEDEDFLSRPITLVDRYVKEIRDDDQLPAHLLPRKTLEERGAIRRTTIGDLMTEAIERARENPDLADLTTGPNGEPLTVEQIMSNPETLNRLGGLVFDDLADSYVMGQTTKDALAKSKIFYEARSDAEMRNALRQDKQARDEAKDDNEFETVAKSFYQAGTNMTAAAVDGYKRVVASAIIQAAGGTNEDVDRYLNSLKRAERRRIAEGRGVMPGDNGNPLSDLGALVSQGSTAMGDAAKEIRFNPNHEIEQLLGSAAGSMVPMLVVGAVGGGAIASGAIGGLSMGESNYQEAIEAGADVDTAMLQFGVGMGLGMTEAIPLAKALSRAKKVGGVGAGKSLVGRAVDSGGTILKGSAEEAIQEMFTGIANNMSAKEFYDYTRELVNEGTFDEGFAGAVLGGLMNTLGAKSRYAQNKEARQLYKKAESDLAKYAAGADVIPSERSLETAMRRRERDVREHYRRKKEDVTDEQVRQEAADLVAKDLTEDIGAPTTANQVMEWADKQATATQADAIDSQIKADAEKAKRENPDLTDEEATAQAKDAFAERVAMDSDGGLTKEDASAILDQAQSIAAEGQRAADAADVATAEEVIGERVLGAEADATPMQADTPPQQAAAPSTQADAPPVAESFEPTLEGVPGAVAPEPTPMPAQTMDAGRDFEITDPNVERAPEPSPMTRKERMQKRMELETRTDELIELAAQETGYDPARVRKDMKREGLDPKQLDEAQDAAALAQYEMLLEDFAADFAPDASQTTTTGTETAATQGTQAATDPTPLAEAATETQPEVVVDEPAITPEPAVQGPTTTPNPVQPTPAPRPAAEAAVDAPPTSEPESVRNARETFGWQDTPIQMEDAGRNRVRITSYPAPETSADINNTIGSIEDVLDDTSIFKRKDQPDNLRPIADAVAASSYTPQTTADLTDLLQTINDVDRIVGKKRRESGVSAQATAIKDALLDKVDNAISSLTPERVAQMDEAELQSYYDFLVDLGDTATTPTQADALTNVERELFGESDSQLEEQSDAKKETLREQKDGGQKEKPRQKKRQRKRRKKKKLSQQEAVDFHLGRSKPKGSWADKTVALLESAMPNVEVVTDPAEFSRVLAAVGRTGPAPRGFVYKGKVYLNPKKMRPDTPIHEYAHLWITQLKANNKAAYDALYKAATESPLFNEIAARYADTLHTQGEIIEEVMAEAIGRAGADVLSTGRPPKGLTNSLLNAIKRAYTWLMGKLGFKGHVSDMTLGALAEREAMRLLAGKKLSELTSEDYAAMMTQRINEQREASKDTSPEQTSREKLKADPDLKKQVVTVAANAYADLLNAEIDTARQRAEARGEKFNVSTAATRAIQKVTFQQYQAAATEAMAKAKVKGLDNLEVAAALENQYRTVSQAGVNQVVKRDLRGATDLKNTLKRFGKEIADANLRYYYQEQLVLSFEQMGKDKGIRGVSTKRLRPFVNALTNVKPTTKGFDQAFGALEKMVNDQQFADRVQAQKDLRKKVMRREPKTENYGARRADRGLWKTFGQLPVGPSVIDVLPDGMDFEGYLKTYEDIAGELLSKTYNKDQLDNRLTDLKTKTTDELFVKKQQKKEESAINYLSAEANRKLFEEYHSEIYGYPPPKDYYKPENINQSIIELAHEVMQIPAREKRAAQRAERQRVERAAAEQRVLELADIMDIANMPVELGANNMDRTGVSILQRTLAELDGLNHREMQMLEQELAYFINNGNVSEVSVKEFAIKQFKRDNNERIKEARKNGNSELRQIHLMGTQRAGTAYFSNEKARAKDGGVVEEAEILYSRLNELMNWDAGLTEINKGRETRLSMAAKRQNLDQFVSSVEEGFKGIKDTYISVLSQMAGDLKAAEKRMQDHNNAVNNRIKTVTKKHRKTLDETSNFKVSVLAAVNQAPTRQVGETQADYEKRRAATIQQNAIAMRRGFTKTNLEKQGYTPAQANKIARDMHEFFHKLRTNNRDADFKPLPDIQQNPETGKFEQRPGGYKEAIGGQEVTLYYTTDPELIKQGLTEGEVALYEEMRDILDEQQPDMKATAQMVYGEAFDLQENYFPLSRKSEADIDKEQALDPSTDLSRSTFSNFTTEAGSFKARADKVKDRNENFLRVDAMRVFNSAQSQTAFSLHAGAVGKQWLNFWSQHNTELWDGNMVKDMLGARHIANDAEARDFAKQTQEVVDKFVLGRLQMMKQQDNALSKDWGEVLAAASRYQYNTVLSVSNAAQNTTDFVRVIAEQAASAPDSIVPGIQMAAQFTNNPNGPYAQHYRVRIADVRDRRLSVKDSKLERALKKVYNKLPTTGQLAGDQVAQVNKALVELGERSVQGVEDMNRSVLFYSSLHEYYSSNGLKWSKAELEKGADPNAVRFAQNRVDNAFATGTKVGRAATFNVNTRWDGTKRDKPEMAALTRMAWYGYRYNMRTQSFNALANLGRFFRTSDPRYLVRSVGNTLATMAWLEAEAMVRGMLNDLVGGDDDNEDSGHWGKHGRLANMAVIENMTSPMGGLSYQLMTSAVETTNEALVGKDYDKFKDSVTMAPSFGHLWKNDDWFANTANTEAMMRLLTGALYFKGKGILNETSRVMTGSMRETDGLLLTLHMMLGIGVRPYASGDIEKALKAYQRAQYKKNKKGGGSSPPPTGFENYDFESLPIDDPVSIEPEYGYGVDDF